MSREDSTLGLDSNVYTVRCARATYEYLTVKAAGPEMKTAVARAIEDADNDIDRWETGKRGSEIFCDAVARGLYCEPEEGVVETVPREHEYMGGWMMHRARAEERRRYHATGAELKNILAVCAADDAIKVYLEPGRNGTDGHQATVLGAREHPEHPEEWRLECTRIDEDGQAASTKSLNALIEMIPDEAVLWAGLAGETGQWGVTGVYEVPGGELRIETKYIG